MRNSVQASCIRRSDGNEQLQVEVDEGAVSARLVKLPQAVNGADTYLELTFNQGGQLAAGASTGRIRYRISKPDGGRFDQTNDYSYQEQPQESSQNTHLVVLVSNQVVWGKLFAGASARLATAPEPGNELSVQVLGNPLEGDQLRVEIRGVQSQPVRLSVRDLSGRLVSERQIEAAGMEERQGLDVSRSDAGILLLQVSTPTQSRVVKVLKVR
ncbi:T9SS type A sorting domain-containing protein [Fibrella forsythiae]|uniref:T9SS type A sorting domain-containing protein n=1 Tax=Fibrella forsythiae TaxID=2817061 RepID=A0ABS3JVK0_9BACT|nr:T9SS type A sorting domain-containing protein [Fibrella forsythiae]MBO0953204.1 T9SS type A sorting domain-containing protein [Fibrella forsythiae]